MTKLRDRYFHTLGFDPDDQSARPRLKAALDRAYQQRSFEIEHYWKRATYFWGFEIAIFAAFGLLLSKDSSTIHPVTVALAGLGLLTALAHSFSARGSKFWQQNWEHHIDMLEDGIEGRLYKMVWLDDGKVSFSVSRINAVLTYCFVGFWFIVVIYIAWKFLNAPPPPFLGFITYGEAYVAFVTLLILLGIWWLLRQTTHLNGTLPNPDGSHGDSIRRRLYRWGNSNTATKSQTFVRRYAPDEGHVSRD